MFFFFFCHINISKVKPLENKTILESGKHIADNKARYIVQQFHF